jgi:4-amino-4-deoxy-L-arabinose transferase-like glycosyltransferase
VLVGFGFLTKMLQAVLVLPAFALAYLVAAPTPLRRRWWQLLAGGAALLVSAGWWVAVVELWPAASRPYIGGSQHNSVLELIFGYNGLGRITGAETGSVGGGNGAGRWGATGLTRLFDFENGGQVSWLVPAAMVLLAAGLWLRRHTRRDHPARHRPGPGRPRQPRRSQWRRWDRPQRGDRQLGGEHLHRHDSRRRHRLRPDGRHHLTGSATHACPAPYPPGRPGSC